MKGTHRRRVLLAAGVLFAASALAGMTSAPAGATASHQQWQVAFSFNCDNNTFCGGQTGGFWGWYAFYSDGTGDATLTGCGHTVGGGGAGAGHETVQIQAWSVDPISGDFVIDQSTPADAEGDTGIPAAPGHLTLHPAPGVSEMVTVKLNPTA